MNTLKAYKEATRFLSELTKSSEPKLLGWQRVSSDKIAVCADLHAPYHSPTWVDRFLAVSRKEKVKDCIIGGDLFQFDEFSKHTNNNKTASFKKSLTSFLDLITAFMAVFDRIYISKGNHDNWLEIFTKGQVSDDDLLAIYNRCIKDFRRKVIVSQYPYIELNNKWRITHSKNYSVIKGSVANKLSSKYGKHICNAHGHFLSFGYSVNGKNFVIDLGGLFDRERMHYVMYSDTTHPVWNNGFLVIENDFPTLYGDHTDWKKEGIK